MIPGAEEKKKARRRSGIFDPSRQVTSLGAVTRFFALAPFILYFILLSLTCLRWCIQKQKFFILCSIRRHAEGDPLPLPCILESWVDRNRSTLFESPLFSRPLWTFFVHLLTNDYIAHGRFSLSSASYNLLTAVVRLFVALVTLLYAF